MGPLVVGGVGEVVVDGVTGTLVPLSDPAALAAALGRYVQDEGLRQRQGHAGRARVEAKFSLPAMVSAYTDLYDALLAGRRPAWSPGRSAIPAEPRGH